MRDGGANVTLEQSTGQCKEKQVSCTICILKYFNPLLWHSPIICHQFSSLAQPCPTLCDPMDCRIQGLSVHHQLLVFTKTHIHRVGDAIQLSHPLLSPSPSAFKHSNIRKVFSSESVLHIKWPKALEFQLQHQSFQ